MLEVYEPEMIRWLFASSRPNAEFSITFEVDIIKLYEDFDKCERIYFDVGEFSEKNKAKQSRIYELSCIDKVPKKIPYQPSFRHLTNVLQVNELDVEKTIGYYEKELKDKFDKDRLRVRAECARNWIEKYAPEEFKFKVQENCQVTLVKEQKKILGLLASKLMEKEWTDVELHEEMYILCTNEEFPPKDFFKLVYQVLVNKEKGPRLASFILEIGKDRVADLLSNI